MLWHFFSKNNASEEGGVAPNLRHGNERARRFNVFNQELHELHDWAMLSGKRVISCNSCNSWLKPTWLRPLASGRCLARDGGSGLSGKHRLAGVAHAEGGGDEQVGLARCLVGDAVAEHLEGRGAEFLRRLHDAGDGGRGVVEETRVVEGD